MEILKINEVGVDTESDPSQLVLLAHKNKSWIVWTENKTPAPGTNHRHRPVVAFSSEKEATTHFNSVTAQLSDF
jgi:hypothetical protein